MGQRHQIYIILPYEFKQLADMDENRYVSSNIITLYHGWLYGNTAGKQLLNFLKFVDNQKTQNYGIFTQNGQYVGNPDEAAKAIYSINIEDGYYSNLALDPNDVAHNPLLTDNNDGITVIDLRLEEPEYCFMFIGAGGHNIEHYVPLTAEQYIGEYYGDHILEENEYWQQNEEAFRKAQELMRDTLSKLSKYKVLSEDKVKDIFPKMYNELNRNK